MAIIISFKNKTVNNWRLTVRLDSIEGFAVDGNNITVYTKGGCTHTVALHDEKEAEEIYQILHKEVGDSQ